MPARPRWCMVDCSQPFAGLVVLGPHWGPQLSQSSCRSRSCLESRLGGVGRSPSHLQTLQGTRAGKQKGAGEGECSQGSYWRNQPRSAAKWTACPSQKMQGTVRKCRLFWVLWKLGALRPGAPSACTCWHSRTSPSRRPGSGQGGPAPPCPCSPGSAGCRPASWLSRSPSGRSGSPGPCASVQRTCAAGT